MTWSKSSTELVAGVTGSLALRLFLKPCLGLAPFPTSPSSPGVVLWPVHLYHLGVSDRCKLSCPHLWDQNFCFDKMILNDSKDTLEGWRRFTLTVVSEHRLVHIKKQKRWMSFSHDYWLLFPHCTSFCCDALTGCLVSIGLPCSVLSPSCL